MYAWNKIVEGIREKRADQVVVVNNVVEKKTEEIKQPEKKIVEGQKGYDNNSKTTRDNNRNSQNRRKAGRGNGNRSNRRRYQNNYRAMTFDDLDQPTQEYYAYMSVQQISYMDEEGYVPIQILCAYPQVACYAVPLGTLMEKFRDRGDDYFLHINFSNGTMKLREKWDMWLMPNGNGGKGVPLYSQTLPQIDYSNGDACDSSAETSTEDNSLPPMDYPELVPSNQLLSTGRA